MTTNLEERLIAIEMAVACAEKTIDELNEVVIAQGKRIDSLKKQNQYLLNKIDDEVVKPMSEETPPPHY